MKESINYGLSCASLAVGMVLCVAAASLFLSPPARSIVFVSTLLGILAFVGGVHIQWSNLKDRSKK